MSPDIHQKKEKLRVALIWPFGFNPQDSFPLPFAYLKSNSDASRFDVRIIDCVLLKINHTSSELKRIIIDINPHVVGLTGFSSRFSECLMLAKLVKSINPNIVTIIGGCHATASSRKVMEYKEFDFLLRGEGEINFNVFLGKLYSGNKNYQEIGGLVYREKESGSVIRNEIRRIENLDSIQLPDYAFVHLNEYILKGYRMQSQKRRSAPILATRGCPYSCSFCSVPKISGKSVRRHSIDYLVRWVSMLVEKHKIEWINIVDDNFTFDKEYAKEFCREIIKKKFKNLSFGTPNGIRMETGDAELWKLMKEAGWRSLIVAPESGSERTLKLMKKGIDLSHVPRIVKDIKAAGLKVQAFFVLGFPGEEKEDILKTGELAIHGGFNFVHLHTFQPLPGTPIYEELVQKKEIEDGSLFSGFHFSESNYTTSSLKKFNLTRYTAFTYFRFFIRNPKNFFYILSYYNFDYFLRKLKEIIFKKKMCGKK